MTKNELILKAGIYLDHLCNRISNRSVGSEGNRQATDYFRELLIESGWEASMDEFDAIDWEDGGATLSCDGKVFMVVVSPYSNGFEGEALLVAAGSAGELENLDSTGKILLLHGEIASEQLMPKNFVFYNPEEHQKIIALLENSGALALVCATGRNAALAGGVYPFPLIEDGDFDIPSVYMTEEEGKRLLPLAGKMVSLNSVSKRIPGKGYNVSGKKGAGGLQRIVVTAHIDAKKGTPGAIDNASGVVVLLLLAGLLNDHAVGRPVELVALNGEDYYSVPGQMKYITSNMGRFDSIFLNINIDGAGYHSGPTAFSPFDLPLPVNNALQEILNSSEGFIQGIPWPQGDHSIFVQSGVPAIAITSGWFIDNISTQEITHTPKDHSGIVDPGRLVDIALAVCDLIKKI